MDFSANLTTKLPRIFVVELLKQLSLIEIIKLDYAMRDKKSKVTLVIICKKYLENFIMNEFKKVQKIDKNYNIIACWINYNIKSVVLYGIVEQFMKKQIKTESFPTGVEGVSKNIDITYRDYSYDLKLYLYFEYYSYPTYVNYTVKYDEERDLMLKNVIERLSNQNSTNSNQNGTNSNQNNTNSEQNDTNSNQNNTNSNQNNKNSEQNNKNSEQNNTNSKQNNTNSNQNNTNAEMNGDISFLKLSFPIINGKRYMKFDGTTETKVKIFERCIDNKIDDIIEQLEGIRKNFKSFH